MDRVLPLFAVVFAVLFIWYRIRGNSGGFITTAGDAFWMAIPVVIVILCCMWSGVVR